MPTSLFQARRQSLQLRVNDAAKSLRDQGISPTVARIRTALGGGSPNDLTPALKHWKESILPTLTSSGERDTAARHHSVTQQRPLPRQVADLAQELWQRALTAAVFEMRAGPTARDIASRSAEVELLRDQLASARNQLERESLACGELRAQATRHEVIAREALTRAQCSEDRERRLLRELGSFRQRVGELEALLEQANSRPLPRSTVKRGVKKGRKTQRVQRLAKQRFSTPITATRTQLSPKRPVRAGK